MTDFSDRNFSFSTITVVVTPVAPRLMGANNARHPNSYFPSGLPAVETVCRPNLVLPRKIHGAALAALVDWMYTGKLTVHRKALGHLPLVANYLKVNIKRYTRFPEAKRINDDSRTIEPCQFTNDVFNTESGACSRSYFAFQLPGIAYFLNVEDFGSTFEVLVNNTHKQDFKFSYR